jgi:Ser-tRNA(Ala) deacylase AlaX
MIVTMINVDELSLEIKKEQQYQMYEQHTISHILYRRFQDQEQCSVQRCGVQHSK